MNRGPLVPVFLVCLMSGAPALAQRSAYVAGRIFDPSGAAVPEAAITVVDQETGFRRLTRSGADGAYVVSSLEPGLYKVTVRKEGFVGMVRFDVKVGVLAAAHADFTLTVGAVQETITVEGTAPLVGQEESSIGVRVYREDIQRLPLNGRGILGLLELSPGTNVTPATRGEAGQFTANGQRPNANYFTVDGASANTGVTAGGLPAQATGGVLPAMSAFGSLDSLLPVEAVDEFRVQTANSVSEPGRLPGASISLTSRSGSNEFHGSAVYRVRHEALAANDWFANASGESRGPLRLHDVAPSLGGPIRRDRTFFFASYRAHVVARILRFAPAGAVRRDARRGAGLGPAGPRSLPTGQRRTARQRARILERPQHPPVAARYGHRENRSRDFFARHAFRRVTTIHPRSMNSAVRRSTASTCGSRA